MPAQLSRYIHAFWKAIQLTLRGETLQPPDKYPELTAWMQQTRQLTDKVITIAEQHGLDETARQAFKLPIDKRAIAMQTILAAVKHNLSKEYPLLITSEVDHFLGAIQALNHNDAYRVGQLAHALSTYPTLQQAVKQLQAQLEALPALQTSLQK